MLQKLPAVSMLTVSLLMVGCGDVNDRVNSVRGSHPSTKQVQSLLADFGTNAESTIITLLKELKSFSSTGEAYVTESSTGTKVLFIYFMGKGRKRNMQGALYSTIPLTVNSQIEIESIDFAQHRKSTCRIYADVSSFLGSGWYEVSYWLD